MSSAAFTSAASLQRPYHRPDGAAAAAAAAGGAGEDDGVGERMYAWEGALDMSWVRKCGSVGVVWREAGPVGFVGCGVVGLDLQSDTLALCLCSPPPKKVNVRMDEEGRLVSDGADQDEHLRRQQHELNRRKLALGQSVRRGLIRWAAGFGWVCVDWWVGVYVWSLASSHQCTCCPAPCPPLHQVCVPGGGRLLGDAGDGPQAGPAPARVEGLLVVWRGGLFVRKGGGVQWRALCVPYTKPPHDATNQPKSCRRSLSRSTSTRTPSPSWCVLAVLVPMS